MSKQEITMKFKEIYPQITDEFADDVIEKLFDFWGTIIDNSHLLHDNTNNDYE